MAFAMQQLRKYATVLERGARNNGSTVGSCVFYVVRSEAITSPTEFSSVRTRVETGSNTSTVTLRVVGGDEKGSLESETAKYGHESYGTRTSSNCKRQTRPLVREGAPNQQTRNCQTIIKIWS
jgi:hypothetical protein